MPNEKQPERTDESAPVNAELTDLASKFASLMESNFIAELPDAASQESMGDFRRQMMSSFITSMCDTGATEAEVAALLQSALNRLLVPTHEPWSDVKNERRVNLIDRSIQGTLSSDEAFELDQLTAEMRRHCETEEAMPTRGARKLHEYLSGLDESASDPD